MSSTPDETKTPAQDYHSAYQAKLADAIRALTDAARLPRPRLRRTEEGNWVEDTLASPDQTDWAEFVTLALAGAAANLGGIDAILNGRSGSWEAEGVRQLLFSTVINLVYTEHARRNLLSEGLHPRRILKTGSPMREVIDAYRAEIDASTVLEDKGLTEGEYFLVSAHREENVDSPERLRMLLDCLTTVHAAYGKPVFVSTHPRTRKRLEALPDWEEPEGITFSDPLGFHDYNKLQLSAACCLSDSGTIAEESSLLGFPAVTLRDSIERPEALDTGGMIMTGLNAEDVVAAVGVAMASGYSRDGISYLTPDDYLIDNTSERTVKFILSTARRHHQWAGIRA